MLQAALLISYPLLVHFSVTSDQPWLQCVAMLCLVAGILYAALKRFNPTAWGVLIALAAAFAFLAWRELLMYVLFLPPLIFPLILFGVFGYTLLPKHEPLVTQIGESARGPLTPEMRLYTKRVTQLWTAVFALLVIEAVVMPLSASLNAWSAMTNGVNYLLVGALFVGEFYYRKWRFPEHDHPNFIEYLQIVSNAGIGRRSG